MFICAHVAPPSVLFQSPLFFGLRSPTIGPVALAAASIIMYITLGLAWLMSMVIRPFWPAGKPPPFTSVHVVPPSVLFQSAEPGPPLNNEYGERRRSQLVANTTFGSFGWRATSTKPALSLTNFTSCQDVPPSVVLYNPRSGLERQAAPSAATYTTLGFVGCTTMRPMCSVFSSPFADQVMPPSVDLKMPPPGSMELREFGSPVPAHTCCVSDGAMASMPIEITRLSSNTGRHVVPLLVVFQMPPPAAAANRVLEGPGMPTTSDMRPMKLAGPTVRQRIPATAAESSA